MDSGERLEDNAIIRNYRVRPRLAELSHSVSITGPAKPWALSPLHPPTELPFLSLYTRSTLPGIRTYIRAPVYMYIYMYIYV